MSKLTCKKVTQKALIFKAAHNQAKAWLASGEAFASYSQAFAQALKKAWAASKGVMTTGESVADILALFRNSYVKVTKTVEVKEGVDLGKIFRQMVENEGYKDFKYWLVPERFLEKRLEDLRRSFYTVEFVTDKETSYYYYAYYK